jgi:hypothetical protein
MNLSGPVIDEGVVAPRLQQHDPSLARGVTPSLRNLPVKSSVIIDCRDSQPLTDVTRIPRMKPLLAPSRSGFFRRAVHLFESIVMGSAPDRSEGC